jgi:uncharacterized phiE125 gp8 family phage protein
MLHYGKTTNKASHLETVSIDGAEPVSATDVRQTLRIDYEGDDTMIERLIVAARQLCEKDTNAAIVEQTVRAYYDEWNCGKFELPKPPLIEVTALEYKSAGEWLAVPSGDFQVVGNYPAFLLTDTFYGYSCDPQSIRVTFRAGFPSGTQLASIEHALIIQAASMYANPTCSTLLDATKNFLDCLRWGNYP